MQSYSTAVLGVDMTAIFQELVQVGEQLAEARCRAASCEHELEVVSARVRNDALVNGAKTVAAADALVVQDVDVIACRNELITATKLLNIAQAREKATYAMVALRRSQTPS